MDESFNQVKSHILLIESHPNVKIAFSLLSREESHQIGGSLSNSSPVNKANAFTFNKCLKNNNMSNNNNKGH